ncbi:MAG TPA: isoamylase early set domain-containing protein [Verrucomicrobiota bacterium]|nr:isoamylase early set domain-containing protein [Verrucomicrobiota bacterium]
MDLSQYRFDRNDRYSAKRSIQAHNFSVSAPQAKTVCLVGDFNQWNPSAHLMTRKPDGFWTIQIPLHHGHHRYQFLVDGIPTLDPLAQGIVRNEKNERVCLVAIS